MDTAPTKLRSTTEFVDAPDVIDELDHQHARIAELICDIGRSTGGQQLATLIRLREYLIMHETAEQIVVRPVVGIDHDESAALADTCDGGQRGQMGRQLRAAEACLREPLWTVEPLNDIVERTCRAIDAEGLTYEGVTR